jgi:hypothetical protein
MFAVPAADCGAGEARGIAVVGDAGALEDDMHTDDTRHCSRRGFLAKTGAAVAALTALPAIADAQDPRLVSDAAVLNYLLKFEYVEAALYDNATTRFLDRDLAPFGANVFSTLVGFRNQQLEHVDILQSLVRRLGLTAQPDCGDRFPRFRNVLEFLQVAFALENAGVSAYLGAVPLLRVPQVQSAVVAIASVESRHSAFIGLLNGESPAPAAADTAKSRDESLAIFQPYLRSCTAN